MERSSKMYVLVSVCQCYISLVSAPKATKVNGRRKSDGRGVRGESVVFSSLDGVIPPLGALEAPSGFSMFGFGGGGDSVGLASSLRVLVLSLLLVMLPGAR